MTSTNQLSKKQWTALKKQQQRQISRKNKVGNYNRWINKYSLYQAYVEKGIRERLVFGDVDESIAIRAALKAS